MKHLMLVLFLLTGNGYRLALPGYVFEFPGDHGSHPEFKTEWWYWTGHLRTARGREFGYQLTFFRAGLDNRFENPSRWRATDLYPAHFALSDLDSGKFHYFERLNRPGPGIAGADKGTLDVWNQDWSARLQGGLFQLNASADGVEIALSLNPTKPATIHGENGVSQKASGAGRASHYYSLTRLETAGTLAIGGETLEVSGLSWMDHEFGSHQLGDDQAGWDWMSVQLDNGDDLMIYGIRGKDGAFDEHSAGTAVLPNGALRHLRRKDFTLLPGRVWLSPSSQSRYPLEWTILIPSLDAELRIETRLDGQELVTRASTRIAYWEGAVDVRGKWRGKAVKGQGYLEMTGYGDGSRPAI